MQSFVSAIKNKLIQQNDDILIRFNPTTSTNDILVWKVFINGNKNLASSFEIHGYAHDVLSKNPEGSIKHNVGCKGSVKWEGTKAIIFASGK